MFATSQTNRFMDKQEDERGVKTARKARTGWHRRENESGTATALVDEQERTLLTAFLQSWIRNGMRTGAATQSLRFRIRQPPFAWPQFL
jgi:hypothetical protein